MSKIQYKGNLWKKIVLLICLFGYVTTHAQVIRYVAPNSAGTANGLSAANASDFLSSNFWADVNNLLQTQPVTVKFIAGNYVRAYTEQPLILSNLGNSNNNLLLEGDGENTVFTAPTGYGTKDVMLSLVSCSNVIVKNFNFTGNGSVGYVFRISSATGKACKNILIENCKWEDMRGIIYGASGASQPNTSYVTYKNCSFKKIGLNGGSHMLYNAYDAHHISVIDSHFEDCTGDYVRFRDNLDYAVVKGSTFIRNSGFVDFPFIAMPLFNDINPGNEIYATNYSFTNNTFTNAAIAIQFYSSGFDPVGRNHLLTAAEGAILTGGTSQQKKDLLLNNFRINTNLVRINNNSYDTIEKQVVIRSVTNYGSVSKGWTGEAIITDLFNSTADLFPWEQDYENEEAKWIESGSLKNINWIYSFAGTPGIISGQGGIIKTSTPTAENFLPTPVSGAVQISASTATSVNSTSFTLDGTNALTMLGNNSTVPGKFVAKSFADNSQVMSAHFTLKLNNLAENKAAAWYIFIGGDASGNLDQDIVGPSTGGNNGPDATTYTVLRFRKTTVAGNYSLEARYHNISSTTSVNWGWHTLAIGLEAGEDVKIDLYCNNSTGTRSYAIGASPYSLATKAYHVWVNGARVGTDGTAELRLIRNFRRNKAGDPSAGSEGHTGNLTALGIMSRETATSEVGGITSNASSASLIISNLKVVHLATPITTPVTLTSFTGSKTANGIALNWKTASEQNNSHFILNHSANDLDFSYLTRLDGKGTTSTINTYNYTDKNPVQGINYYQLVQFDSDGNKTVIDKVVDVKYGVSDDLFTVSKVSSNQLKAVILSEKNENAELQITDISGKVIYKATRALKRGNNQIDLFIPVVQPGVYIASVKRASNFNSIKFLF